ncbi:MAG: Asp-tRNA(Asn)/Glu-tRNA(Gln) amidotransferase subunit GatC [Candidatus Moranbacteria bacterium]|nr:Asp-tRNA(Asn)/Glu-tRNA(Gln) amidotransferase subunit GatC [Candidatus Moranbacteria bacterium]
MVMLSSQDIKHVANLSRIELSSEEEEMYRKEMSVILEYVQKLDELDTDGVEPIGHITGMINSYREDVSYDGSVQEKEALMKNVPEVKNKWVRVKKVLG